MTTKLPDLYTARFDALEALDQQIDGYGLYAIRAQQKDGDLQSLSCYRFRSE